MSIRATITALEAAGKLTAYVPIGQKLCRRRLYLAADALKDINDPLSAVNVLVGKGEIMSALTRWTKGERVHARRGKPRFLKRLVAPPPDIWEMMITEPQTQARLFGRFAEPDTLILTKFHTRSMLGNKGSRPWNQAMTACETTWNGLFGPNTFFTSTTIHDYVTENCDDYPLQ